MELALLFGLVLISFLEEYRDELLIAASVCADHVAYVWGCAEEGG